MKKTVIQLAIVALAMLSVSFSAQAEIRTGQWETTITTEVEGLPFAPPPMTFSECVTEEDLVPSVEPPDQHCDVMEQEIQGNRVSWRLRCSQDGVTTVGSGEIRYQGDTYQGEMNVTMSGGPMGEITMRQTLQGRRLGECR